MALPLSMTLKRSELDPKNRPLEISATHINWDGKSIACDAIDEVKYGSIRMSEAATGLWIADIHELQFRGGGAKLRITFSSSFGKARRDETAERYGQIEDALFEAVTGRLATQVSDALSARRPITVAGVELDAAGARVRAGVVFKKQHQVAWDDLAWSVDNGALIVGSRAQPKIRQKLGLSSTWNAVVLAHALRMLGAGQR